ncbi:hypothetical protein SDC9_110123 [bioreactor metagenome]|uniref:Uncharacterized protein n=1 Tax=bioreactor metagenome TaxID=1076179 RepID=A0A645BJ70_9ZZZZ
MLGHRVGGTIQANGHGGIRQVIAGTDLIGHGYEGYRTENAAYCSFRNGGILIDLGYYAGKRSL